MFRVVLLDDGDHVRFNGSPHTTVATTTRKFQAELTQVLLPFLFMQTPLAQQIAIRSSHTETLLAASATWLWEKVPGRPPLWRHAETRRHKSTAADLLLAQALSSIRARPAATSELAEACS